MEAKKLKDPTTKYYFNKITGDELFELLSIAVQNAVEIVAWLKGQENDVQIYYPTRLDKNEEKLYLEYRPSLLRPMKSNFIEHKIFLKMNMEKYYIFAHAKLHFESGTYFLDTSSVFYKSQQRENLRFQSSPEFDIKMQIKFGEDIYNLNDVSASGASFFVPKEKISQFEMGKIYTHIFITLETDTFRIPKCEVIKELESPNNPPPNHKCLAVKFLNIYTSEETKLVVKLTSLIRAMELLKAKKKKT
jgi:hypothetical protein